MFLIINNFSFQCFDFQSIIHKQCFVNKFFFDFQSIFNDYFLFIFFPPSLLDCGIILEISLLTTIWKSSVLPLLIMASLILILPTITDLNREVPKNTSVWSKKNASSLTGMNCWSAPRPVTICARNLTVTGAAASTWLPAWIWACNDWDSIM